MGVETYIKEKTLMQIFISTVVAPFWKPIAEAHESIGQKFILGFIYYFVIFYDHGASLLFNSSDIFSIQKIWVEGIIYLVILDFAAGVFRAITDVNVKFRAKYLMRTAFKIPAYLMACLAVTIGANMFPTPLGWVQYMTFVILCGVEINSILRNLKMTALLSILYEEARKKSILNLDTMKLGQMVEQRSRQQFQRDQDDKFANDNEYRRP